MRHSLRLRLLAGGFAAILVALVVAGIGLELLFERHVARTLADDLDVQAKQLLSGLSLGPDGAPLIAREPVDPRFDDPLSGLYWQVDVAGGEVLRSRSLWDATLALPRDELQPGETHLHETIGPASARVLVLERGATLTDKGRPVVVRVSVAVNLARISAAGRSFGRDLAVALALLGLVLAGATAVQVVLGLRPLDALRDDVAAIRSGKARRLTPVAPAEVQPLVAELNALLAAQEGEIERSRAYAADLAHGLKTPLAALMADVERLRERGEDALASRIATVGTAMSRHVDRELARVRLRGTRTHGLRAATEIEPLARSLVETLARTPQGQRIAFDLHIEAGTIVPMERGDLAEVLGNLLENAARHAHARVHLAALPDASITVEDDGRGIAPEHRAAVLQRGTRLDERGGAGLGLAIVLDILDAYGWRLELGESTLGGLAATFRPAER
ncbi:MAG: sensor histidine kinase [Steroidobacteraceae bacterium]